MRGSHPHPFSYLFGTKTRGKKARRETSVAGSAFSPGERARAKGIKGIDIGCTQYLHDTLTYIYIYFFFYIYVYIYIYTNA